MIDKAAKRGNLDAYGDLYGIERKRFIIFFRETDRRYRKRIICELERMRKELPNHERNHIVYVVEKGDNLWNISKSWLGVGMRYKEIANLNGIEKPDFIYPGQVLILPER